MCAHSIHSDFQMALLKPGIKPQVQFLFLFFIIETGSPCIAQDGLELLGSNSPPASASQSAVAQSQLTATSTSQVQVILLPQPPE